MSDIITATVVHIIIREWEEPVSLEELSPGSTIRAVHKMKELSVVVALDRTGTTTVLTTTTEDLTARPECV